MYSIDGNTQVIHFPDGFVLPPPYESERYLEYAAWVQEGNSPEVIVPSPLRGAVETVVKADRARIALARKGVYQQVLALMADVNTPDEIKIQFEYTGYFSRNNPSTLLMASVLGWDGEFLDELFAVAESLG